MGASRPEAGAGHAATSELAHASTTRPISLWRLRSRRKKGLGLASALHATRH